MESKKINQLATNVNPQTSDLTTIGDPITGQLKKITWLQVAHLIGAQASVTLQQVTDNGNTTTDPITTGGLTLTNIGTGVVRSTNGEVVGTYGYGLANGVATLDSGGKIPAAQLPSSVMEYKGTWNASTNTPTLADGTGDNGDVYLVNVAGSQNLGSGTISFAVGDWVVYNGTIWQKSLNSNAVASVFGRTGTITAQEGDYNIDQLGDVAITSAAANDYLRYTGSSWVNTPFPSFVSSDKLVLAVRNNSGATINKGTVVYINGATAGYPTIAKALATGDATSAQTMGVVQDNISNNANGYVVAFGQITGIDTSAYAAGTQLYLSSTTAGAFTSTKQYAPNHLVYVGVVTTQNAVNGVIEVRVQNGFELDEIHDVSAQNPSNNDGIFYNSTTELWEKKSIATVLGYTPEQPLTFSAPLSRSTNTISIPVATSSADGYLSSTDWTTFNNKLTSPMTTLGDIIYGGASGVATRLAGNTTTTRKFLRQTGDATNSAAPAWDILVSGDIPNNAANTTGSAATLTTARNFTINGTAKSFDGSANVSWTAAEIGLTSYLPLTGGTLTGNLSISTVFTSGNIPFLVNNTTGWGFYNGAESTLDFNYGRNETSTGYINYVGYQGGSTQFRNLIIADGKGNTIATFTGSTKQTSLSGALSGTSASFSSFITAQSTGGSGLRIYGGSGTNQWDIYLNSTNLRFSDNTGTGSVVFDRPLSGTSATFSNDVYVQESGNALLRVHSNTTSTPIADIELMRGTNATWGADAYGDYRIRNSGGDLIFQYGDTGVTSTRFTIQSSGNAAFNSTASFAGNVTLSGGSDLIITPATSGVNATLYNDIGVLVSTASISVQGTGVFSSSVSATSATFTTSITPLIIKGTNAATMWTEYYYNTSTLSGYIGSGDGLLSGANASDFIVRSQADFVIAAGGNNRRLTIGSTGAATFSSAVAGYAMSITNVEDSSQGLLLRSTDADTTLYLARFQSSASAVSQTWVDRFSIAKSGNAVLGDNIPYANIRFYIKGEDQGAGNYALNIADGSGQDIAWFRNDKAIRFLGATTLTYTYNGGGNGMLHLTSGGTEGGSITFEKTSGTAQKYKVGNSGTEFFIYNETAGNKPFALENNGVITTRSSSTEPFKIYGDTAGINGLLRIQIDEVNDSFGTGARTFIGDGGIDIFIGTGNSSYTPANSYIALNHSGEISMGAGSATKHLTIATTGTSTFRNSLLANSPSEGATGEGLIAGQSFKIDATGTGQTAKMYIVSNTLSNTYGSGLTLQAANFAGDKGFGFNLSSSYSGAFELYLRSSSTWALRYRFRPSGRTDWSNDSYMVSDTNGFRFNDSTDSYNNFVALNNGNATLRGTLTQNASDLRLKNNIRKIESALNKVQKINGVTFDWLENIESLGFSPKNKINDAGVIAQEIKDVLPQAVDYAPFDMKDGKSISGNNYLTVHYEKIVPLLIEAIKELKTEVDSLKK